MDPKNIVLLGIKGTVIAFQKNTGARLWSAKLKSGLSVDFVSVVADDARVYAHTGGEFYCLDIQTGGTLWQDPLAGLGYGVASVTLASVTPPPIPAAFEKKRQDDASAQTAVSTTS